MNVKKTMIKHNKTLHRAKLMQTQEIAEDKLEQNEDLAKLRAGVSLAKTGIEQDKYRRLIMPLNKKR